MRFMMMYKPGTETCVSPSEEQMRALGQHIDEMKKAGILLSMGGLQPSANGTRVRVDGGKFTVVDGPFAETKELIAGYVIVEVASKAEAVALAKRFLGTMGQGESEIRPMQGASDSATCAENAGQANYA